MSFPEYYNPVYLWYCFSSVLFTVATAFFFFLHYAKVNQTFIKVYFQTECFPIIVCNRVFTYLRAGEGQNSYLRDHVPVFFFFFLIPAVLGNLDNTPTDNIVHLKAIVHTLFK